MPSYLIVAYQTAGGEALRKALEEVARSEQDATFRLLVPATHSQHLFTWSRGESTAAARATAEAAAEQLRSSGVPLTEVIVGDPDPFVAVFNELTIRPECGGIIVSTFPPGVSRWLRLDLPARLEKRTGLPVTHVIVGPEDSSSTS